jgi:hypothetical protein
MSQLEYLIPLVSIIVGLGLADLARSLRELVRPSRAVRWHWLPLVWTAVVLLVVLRLWWASFSALQQGVFGEALAFLPYLLVFLGLYLACSFALPDPSRDQKARSTDEPLDLEAFHFSEPHRRWFFGTIIAVIVLFDAVNVAYFYDFSAAGVREVGGRFAGSTLAVVLLAALIVTDRWWVHAAVSTAAVYSAVTTLAVGAPPLGG